MTQPTPAYIPTGTEAPTEPVYSPRIPLALTTPAEQAEKDRLEKAWAARVHELVAAGKTPVHRCVMENLQTNDYLILLHVQTGTEATR